MKANVIKVGTFVDLGTEKSPHGPHMDRVRAPAEVLEVGQNSVMVELRLRQIGKLRGCWVRIPAEKNVRTVRR